MSFWTFFLRSKVIVIAISVTSFSSHVIRHRDHATASRVDFALSIPIFVAKIQFLSYSLPETSNKLHRLNGPRPLTLYLQ